MELHHSKEEPAAATAVRVNPRWHRAGTEPFKGLWKEPSRGRASIREPFVIFSIPPISIIQGFPADSRFSTYFCIKMNILCAAQHPQTPWAIKLHGLQDDVFRGCAPGRTRTCGLRFRKPSLYPPELRGRNDLQRRDSSLLPFLLPNIPLRPLVSQYQQRSRDTFLAGERDRPPNPHARTLDLVLSF